MSILSDLKILYHLALAPNDEKTQKERLEKFYSNQAEGYDAFRARLLHGREEMYRSIPIRTGDHWADIGGGTAANLECIAGDLPRLARVDVVDLSSSLLKIAQERIRARNWNSVYPIEADATTYSPSPSVLDEGKCDIVTFSYSLSMIPDALAALENAHRILKPGGIIGAVDFYVSHKHPPAGLIRHPWLTRTAWPAWFGFDNVFLSPEPLLYLRRNFEIIKLEERRGKVPYLPFVRAPYYIFIGQKRV